MDGPTSISRLEEAASWPPDDDDGEPRWPHDLGPLLLEFTITSSGYSMTIQVYHADRFEQFDGLGLVSAACGWSEYDDDRNQFLLVDDPAIYHWEFLRQLDEVTSEMTKQALDDIHERLTPDGQEY